MPSLPRSFDNPQGRKNQRIARLAVREGLRGTEAPALFDGLSQRLVTGSTSQ
jgi:hypothetical protein